MPRLADWLLSWKAAWRMLLGADIVSSSRTESAISNFSIKWDSLNNVWAEYFLKAEKWVWTKIHHWISSPPSLQFQLYIKTQRILSPFLPLPPSISPSLPLSFHLSIHPSLHASHPLILYFSCAISEMTYMHIKVPSGSLIGAF